MEVIQNYTLTLNFVKKKLKTLKQPIGLQSQANCDDKKSKKILHVLENNTSGVQVGDIEQMIVYNLFIVQEIILT